MGDFVLNRVLPVAAVVGIIVLQVISARSYRRRLETRAPLDLRISGSAASRIAVGLLCVVSAGLVGYTAITAYSGGSAGASERGAVTGVFMVVTAALALMKFFVRWPGRRSSGPPHEGGT